MSRCVVFAVLSLLVAACEKKNAGRAGAELTIETPNETPTLEGASRPNERDAAGLQFDVTEAQTSTSSQQLRMPPWLHLLKLPKAPQLSADACPLGTKLIETDLIASRCQSSADPRISLSVLSPKRQPSTELMIIVQSNLLQGAYGYSDGYIVDASVCRNDEDCLRTSYGPRGLRLAETTTRGGNGVYMTTFHPNGQKAEEGPLKSEGKFGRWTYYDTAGKLIRSVVHELDGELEEP